MDLGERIGSFTSRFGMKIPIMLAPMAGASDPQLSAAVCLAGGMRACGCLLMQPSEILAWAGEVRASSSGPFQLNLWVPDPAPERDHLAEAAVREFLGRMGPGGAR